MGRNLTLWVMRAHVLELGTWKTIEKCKPKKNRTYFIFGSRLTYAATILPKLFSFGSRFMWVATEGAHTHTHTLYDYTQHNTGKNVLPLAFARSGTVWLLRCRPLCAWSMARPFAITHCSRHAYIHVYSSISSNKLYFYVSQFAITSHKIRKTFASFDFIWLMEICM